MSNLIFRSISGRWVINIPCGNNRILVISRGKMLKSGKFNNWLPCTYFVRPKPSKGA